MTHSKADRKKWWLKKDGLGEFSYIDQDGVSHDMPETWLWSILGGCGCGSSDHLSDRAWEVLSHFGEEIKERDFNFIYDNELNETLAHWLDSFELIEHGSGIAGSWLTEKGKEVYQSITKLK